jgi:dolichyl-diphosphooligosaccharide--protein glycosyltransferase
MNKEENKNNQQISIYIQIILWLIAAIQIFAISNEGLNTLTYISVVILLIRYLGAKTTANISEKIKSNPNIGYIIGFICPIIGTLTYIIYTTIKHKHIKLNKCFVNYSKTILIILLIVISMYSALHFRTYTYDLPVTENWAKSSVLNQYKSQIKQQVDAEFPNLPPANKESIVNQRANELYQEKKQEIDAFTKQLSKTYKQDFQDENNKTYLLALDPYYYYRRSANILETGSVCDEIVNDTCMDDHMVAPKGKPTKLHGLDVIEVGIFKISRIFNPDTKLKDAIFIIPALIIMLGVIPAFFLVKKYAGLVGGFVAAMIVALHPYLIGRTPAGFVDTDAFGITMPLFIIWFIIEAFSSKKTSKKIIFSALAGFSTWLFNKTWGGGWYFAFDIIVAILIGMILYQIIKIFIDHKSNYGKRIIKSRIVRSELLIVLIYILVVMLLIGVGTITKAFTAPLNAAQFQDASKSGNWPNVFTTVAELNAQDLSNITNALVSNTGNLFQVFMILILLAIPLSLIKRYDKNSWYYLAITAIIIFIISSKKLIQKISPNFYILIILMIFMGGVILNLMKDKKDRASILLPAIATALLMGTLFASLRGIRFVLLGINTYAILLGLSIGILFLRLSRGLKKSIDLPEIVTKTIVVVIAISLLFTYVNAAHQTGLSEMPQMNDAWYQSLNKIDQEAAPNAIISSWWDFGHWFKAIADRPVTFDGASQNSPMAHWIGKSLATNKENLSIGILRMLDCGSNDAFDALNEEFNDTYKTVNLLDEIVQVDKTKAKKILEENNVKKSIIQKTLANTHCNPPEAYYITSEDMVGKAGVWSHFGLWDFMKADLYNTGKKMNYAEFKDYANKYDLSEERITELYDQIKLLQNEKQANTWISGWPGFSKKVACFQENASVKCNINVQIGTQNNVNLVFEKYLFDLENETGTAIVGAYRGDSRVGETNMSLAKFVTDVGGKLKTYNFNEGIDFGIMNVGNQGLLGSKELVDSVFAKLFYFDGAYTKHFDKFSDKSSSTTGDRILIWKIDWEGQTEINSEE